MKNLIDTLCSEGDLPDEELKKIIDINNREYLAYMADKKRKKYYGNDVYVRGLIEVSNFCKNDCYYCGIRCSNRKLDRYRLTKEEIIDCCKVGYALGLRTFVLQGGEDVHLSDKWVCEVVCSIKENHPDCALTLSLGEKEYDSYKAFFNAGADRYLLRHETADSNHYSMLHPDSMSLANRKKCLWDLKEIGYQVGAGFMVGSPWQTADNLVADLRFLQELSPDMVGIGPFLPHSDTPFALENKGSMQKTLNLISIVRLMLPHALIPSTTALATIHPEGRQMGLKSGANVVMPNLSPLRVRKMYQLYDDKVCTGEESAQSIKSLGETVKDAGYEVRVHRGDVRR